MNNFQIPPARFLLQRQEEIKVTSDGGIILPSGHQGSGWSEEATRPEKINGILSHGVSWASLGALQMEAMHFPWCCAREETWVRVGLNQKAVLKPGTEEVSVSLLCQDAKWTKQTFLLFFAFLFLPLLRIHEFAIAIYSTPSLLKIKELCRISHLHMREGLKDVKQTGVSLPLRCLLAVLNVPVLAQPFVISPLCKTFFKKPLF